MFSNLDCGGLNSVMSRRVERSSVVAEGAALVPSIEMYQEHSLYSVTARRGNRGSQQIASELYIIDVGTLVLHNRDSTTARVAITEHLGITVRSS